MNRLEPPDRLVSDAVVLARARPSHIDGFHAAVETSHAELRQFMNWAQGDTPQAREVTLDVLATWQVFWRERREFNYVMTDPVTGEVIGGCGLMTRQGPGRLEVGYWVRSDRAAAGIATAAARLLTDAAFGLRDIEAVVIHHDAANVASGRVAEKLGFTEAVRREVDITSVGEVGVEVVWEIRREAWT
ncbi:MAG: acetyltransferase [Acidimicrobiales bacterium]|nr:MAG: acetyltransferase [Acidimicrobiales bacterium]